MLVPMMEELLVSSRRENTIVRDRKVAISKNIYRRGTLSALPP